MNTPDNDGWICVKTHGEPSSSAYPIYAYDEECHYDSVWHIYERLPTSSFSHWKRAPKLPAPPKKELTQREEDEKAGREWYALRWASPTPTYCHMIDSAVELWHAALSYRDKQNAEDLKLLISDDGYLVGALRRADATHRLRKRCGLNT